MLSTPSGVAEPPRPAPLDLPLSPLLNGQTPYAVRFRYDPAAPWTVTLHCLNPSGWLDWVLSRDLLAMGMSTETGEGDVHVVPEEGHVWLVFSTPEGWACLRFGRGDLEHALDLSEALVPPGTEEDHTDWNTALAALADPA